MVFDRKRFLSTLSKCLLWAGEPSRHSAGNGGTAKEMGCSETPLCPALHGARRLLSAPPPAGASAVENAKAKKAEAGGKRLYYLHRNRLLNGKILFWAFFNVGL